MRSHITPGRGPRSRRWPLVAMLAAAALAIGGCSGSGGDNGGDAGGGAITLDFWNGFTGPDQPALEKIIADFNAAHDDIQVKNNPMPWDVIFDKSLAAVRSDDGPDILSLPSDRLPQFAAQGVLESFDDFYADPGNETDKLAPAAVTGARYDGTAYGVPVSYSNIMMYVNKDMFAKAGLDYPTTWDEFAAAVPKLTVDKNGDGKPEQYAIALADHATLAMYQPMLWNNGGGVVSEDGKTSLLADPATIKALEFWVDLVKNKHASPIGLDGGGADNLFKSGKAAMEIVGPWMTTGFDQADIHYDVVRPFAGPNDNKVLAITVAATIPVSADEATKAAGYEFLRFLNSKEQQTHWAVGSGFPPNRIDVPAKDLAGNKWSAKFGDPTVTASARLYLPGVVNFAKINDSTFTPALQKALNGEGSVQDLFTAASSQVQAALESK